MHCVDSANVAGESRGARKGPKSVGKKRKEVEIYSDGACSGNPGPGGYGTILVYKGHEKELSGGEAETTNNRMELLGAISGLKALKEPCRVTLTSDSKYMVDGINEGWAENWQRNGWKKADRKPALNVDLWEELLALTRIHEVTFVWIKGHDGHPYNERCDRLAVKAAEQYKNERSGQAEDAAAPETDKKS